VPYTLSLDGRVVGETEFEHPGPDPRQRVGVFRPTEHGLEVLPRVTGLLTAALALKQAMVRRGISHEDADTDAVMDLLENTAEGQKVVEHAKALDALELRDPSGQRVPFTSIAVSDLRELRRLAAEIHPTDDAMIASDCDDGPQGPQGPDYVISATFGAEDRVVPRARRITAFRWRPFSQN
jgi:hypothetical protein